MNARTILMTGACGGLGRGVVEHFLACDASLCLVAHPTEVEQLKQVIEQRSTPPKARVSVIGVDLTAEPEVASLFDRHRPGKVVHLVGGFSMGPIHELELEDYRRLVDINLTTTVVVLKHAVRWMRAHEYGRIVTIASQNAESPAADVAAYSATKAAVLALTRSVAEEGMPFNITANCILPSIIDTPANRAAMGSQHAAAWTTPERIAQAIAYLISDDAGDLRGAALRLYGRV